MKILNKIIAMILIIIILQFFCVNFVYAATNKPIVLVLDPGHGGKMTGTVNNELGIIERDVTLKIAKYLRDYLNQYENIQVIMTHEGLPSDYEMELPARGMIARNNNADMMISLHINDSTIQGENGAEVYVTKNTLLPKYNQESTKFGNIVLNKLSALGIRNRGVKTRLCNDRGPKWEYSDGSVADYYAVIRYPMKGDGEDRGADLEKGEGIPGILIEHCFMKGHDSQFLDTEEDIQKLAKADCDAIVEYYGLEKKDPTRVSSISLNNTNVILAKGEKVNLTATVTPNTAKNKNVTWSSSDENVAKVNSNGEVTAIGAGTATITAKTADRGKTATATVTVKEIEIVFNKKEINLIVGNKTKISYTISPDNLTNKEVTWKSSNTEIATVDENGTVTALKEGQVTITANIEESNITANMTVNIYELKEEQKIKVNNLKQENDRLSKIHEKTTVADFKKNFEISSDLEIIVKNNENKVIEDTEYVGTASNVIIQEKESKKVIQEYNTIIYGDINKDGKVSSGDYVLIKNHIMTEQKINNRLVNAADVNGDGKISSGDYVLIKNHIMKGTNLRIE